MKRLALFSLMLAALPSAAFAQFTLSLPIACEPGKDCFVQNFVDHDEAKGKEAYKDFTCGRASYDGHDGTDFRLRSMAAMEAGVDVLAAADGQVKGQRDGVDDVNIRDITLDAVKNRECGNGVALKHAQGWETQYCHMKKGTVRVKTGDVVKRGDVLGQVGMSGLTEFPHLHLTVRHFGKAIDPFVGHSGSYECEEERRVSMWNADAKAKLEYAPAAVLGIGFTDHSPTQEEVFSGKLKDSDVTPDDGALVAWITAIGMREGDKLSLKLTNPNGTVMAENAHVFDRSKAQVYFIAGKVNRTPPWAPGTYTAELVIGEPQQDGSIVPRLSETRQFVMP